MPQYMYQVRSKNGRIIKGKLSSMDKSSAVEELRKRGLTVLSVSELRNSWLSADIYIGNPVKGIHFIIFCRQFATLIRAGVTIVESTAILSEQTESKPLKKALIDVNSSLLRGIPFSQAAQEHKKIFPPMFISMVRAGEETGDLEGTLDRLAVFFEKAHTTKEKIKSAMTYPIVVGIMAIAAVIYLLQGVVPQFVTMFESFDAELPFITQVVLSLSNSISNQWYIWLLTVIAILLAFQMTKRSKRGSYMIDYAKLKIPIFGKLLQKGAIAQMTRTLSSLYASSVPVLQSLSIVEEVVGNKVIGEVIRKSGDSLRQGTPLSDPLKRSWVFPPLVTQMIAVGEETGALDQMLSKVADFYEMDVDNTVDRLKALIEPLLIVFLAGIVGLIVMAIMLPMFSLYSTVG
ncbi:type II secretion system F family protein [Paenibacillus sp. sgz302251]|uniref:type II secretion system F family protein n=1 Tax=Paenibacillus sp. sgz302251 TaxID=3414493 RepID=UPI003C7B7D29